MEQFPDVFDRVLEIVREKGSHMVVFDTKEQCYAERLRFYRFLARAKESKDEMRAMLARSIVVEWKKDTRAGHTPEKRVLVVRASAASTGAWLDTNEDTAREIAENAEKEALMRALREEALAAAREMDASKK